MRKDITSYNEQGLLHGYWESYYNNGLLAFKGSYINGYMYGYWESYYNNGLLAYKGSYINGIREGYFIEYQNKSYYKFFHKNDKRYYKNRYVGYRFLTF